MQSILIKTNGERLEIPNNSSAECAVLLFLNIADGHCTISPNEASVDKFSAMQVGMKNNDNELLLTFIDGDKDAWDCTLDEIEETKGTLLLQLLNGRCSDFHTEVKKLQRPYVPITKEQYDALFAVPNDYYKFGNDVVTFGGADGGYALMPLQSIYAKAILEARS
ncbi:hypothetical protein [Sulfurospirillum multivorans]|uniref:Uncharacterized protein n=2 Tax=Sulfurospirillum multivorans TaxID=66821 RepID=A0AA86AM72_SULMK|nr:hypothetical protein [Sulfurospirillum multivorans]AHJ13059.1 hypothetical protein SMUL_1804 [Sulfurospirillum multivorans DSM 12446]QEH06547.1 hypothetical protein SMN_1782 [Sulfurospirillum multivorans]